MPQVPSYLLDGSVFGQQKQPGSIFDIQQPGQLDLSSLFAGRQSWEGLPPEVLGPLLFATRQPWTQPQGFNGPSAAAAGSTGTQGGLGMASSPTSTTSIAPSAQNFGTVAGGFLSSLNPVGTISNMAQQTAGRRPSTVSFMTQLGRALGLPDTVDVNLDEEDAQMGQNMANFSAQMAAANPTAATATAQTAEQTASGLGLGVDGSGGGGDGGSKVICTYLRDIGLLNPKLYEAAHNGYPIPPDVKRGYLLWAIPVVMAMQDRPWLRRLAAPFCRAWSAHVAHLRYPEQYGRHLPGAFLHGLGWGLCGLIGRLSPRMAHG